MKPPKWLEKAMKPLIDHGTQKTKSRKASQKIALWIAARCYELSLKAGLLTV